MSKITKQLRELFDGAKKHGNDSEDPDHEVGDLQDIICWCWHHLTSQQREDVLAQYRAARKE